MDRMNDAAIGHRPAWLAWTAGRQVALLVGALLALPGIAQERRQVGEMVLEDVPAWDDALRERMLQYLNTRGATLRALSDNGARLLISTRFGETEQLHVVETPMGMRRQVTFRDEPIGSAFFVAASDGGRVLYTADVGGNEASQVFLFDRQTGQHRMLTDGAARNDSPVDSPDGRTAAWSGTARNGRDFDIYTCDITSPDAQPRRLWEVDGAYYCGAFSPDSGTLLVVNYVSARETHWFALDVASGQQRRLTPESPPRYYGDAVWSADGRAIYLTSDRESDFRKLHRLELAGGTWSCLTTDIDWDVDDLAVDPTSGAVAFVTNDDGLSRLYFCDADGGGRREVSGLPTGIIAGLEFSRRGSVLGLTLNAAAAPSDVYTVSYPAGAVTRWTESEVGGLNPDNFVSPEVVRFPTFDEVNGQPRQISAFYYKARQPGPRPAVILCHGGPESQYRPNFSSNVQFWAHELGVSVLCPNVRGSTGYGREFHQADNGVLREDSIRDVGALLDWIDKQPELDSRRVGIFGGSYGGYMVLGSLMNYPDRIRAGVDYVGVADFITFLENTSEYRRDLRREEYGDERDPQTRAVLERISPLRNAEKIRSALFVIHGANDPRVPLSEAQQIVAKMRELGRPVWFANALNEGHGFRKRQNSDLAAVLFAHFFREQLLK